jgi:hypothetical protein
MSGCYALGLVHFQVYYLVLLGCQPAIAYVRILDEISARYRLPLQVCHPLARAGPGTAPALSRSLATQGRQTLQLGLAYNLYRLKLCLLPARCKHRMSTEPPHD